MDRVVRRVAIAASAAMLLWMARPLCAGDVPFTGDLLHFHYPLRDFYARALTAGQRFDWMPSLFGGFYVVGEGQLGGYHPLHWLLYRFVTFEFRPTHLGVGKAISLSGLVLAVALAAGSRTWRRRRSGATGRRRDDQDPRDQNSAATSRTNPRSL